MYSDDHTLSTFLLYFVLKLRPGDESVNIVPRMQTFKHLQSKYTNEVQKNVMTMTNSISYDNENYKNTLKHSRYMPMRYLAITDFHFHKFTTKLNILANLGSLTSQLLEGILQYLFHKTLQTLGLCEDRKDDPIFLTFYNFG